MINNSHFFSISFFKIGFINLYPNCYHSFEIGVHCIMLAWHEFLINICFLFFYCFLFPYGCILTVFSASKMVQQDICDFPSLPLKVSVVPPLPPRRSMRQGYSTLPSRPRSANLAHCPAFQVSVDACLQECFH